MHRFRKVRRRGERLELTYGRFEDFGIEQALFTRPHVADAGRGEVHVALHEWRSFLFEILPDELSCFFLDRVVVRRVVGNDLTEHPFEQLAARVRRGEPFRHGWQTELPRDEELSKEGIPNAFLEEVARVSIDDHEKHERMDPLGIVEELGKPFLPGLGKAGTVRYQNRIGVRLLPNPAVEIEFGILDDSRNAVAFADDLCQCKDLMPLVRRGDNRQTRVVPALTPFTDRVSETPKILALDLDLQRKSIHRFSHFFARFLFRTSSFLRSRRESDNSNYSSSVWLSSVFSKDFKALTGLFFPCILLTLTRSGRTGRFFVNFYQLLSIYYGLSDYAGDETNR
ncbi:hypothetical protein COX00_00630 [Candidatus Uhrbacteria bacterium CG22_combo_CG10-13_8_21_14_all_47_17]|uniref:Uncharacterized protein n=1 Tax=Candidatus Uhrbacteria bacterium CG22_combo_CG10-13_8_21_14_all_47_17 TaxID=1975041 RepID=A0A2H0BTC0_9BACT|nr:MAG: hypothetical protein COX00_00630 [Candidatus Uhrbacteria bacterium CG22_combo_CG10-13_8_21_14_all_47_17]